MNCGTVLLNAANDRNHKGPKKNCKGGSQVISRDCKGRSLGTLWGHSGLHGTTRG